MDSVRIDKWLWAARFYKTRTLAREMVSSGKVHVDGQRTKPSKNIHVGQVVKLPKGHDIVEVVVRELSEQRRGAPEAQLLYEETASSVERRQKEAELRRLNMLYNPHPDTKPDKKQRRDIRKFRTQTSD